MFTSTPRNGHTSAVLLLFSIVAALLLSPGTAHASCPGEGDCCEANGSPGCKEETCCELICAQDPFCCEVEWDIVCADAVFGTCIVPDCFGPYGCIHADPSFGDCCSANDSPICSDQNCCEIVCANDPFCCDTKWDSYCADAASRYCAVCLPSCPGEGSCCEGPNDTPGCEDKECCELICDVDPFCCRFEWDELCVQQANNTCICGHPTICGFESSGDCCQPNGSPGCDNLDCCDAVCPIDPFCCDTKWDHFCADLAFKHCTVCSTPGDLNGDGVVDILDLLILLENWGDCRNPDDCPADLNGDGTVNINDLLFMLENWS